MSRRIRFRKKRQNRFSMALVIMVIFMVVIVIAFKRNELSQKQKAYDKKAQQLEEEIAEEEKRSQEIDEYEIYTKTKKYVEETAKEKLGLVKENEIIFQSGGE